MKTGNLPAASQRENRNASIFVAACLRVALFPALLCALSIPTLARTSQQQQLKDKLGSLTSLGEVYVNDSSISVVSAVSSGDKIRTGESGEATLAVAGKGTLKIGPLSQVILSGNDQYTAELQKGTVQLNSVPGSDGLIVRIGGYVVVPTVRSVAITLRVTKAQDGSFLVSCLDGKIGVLTLEGKSGRLLQAGQSLTVSPTSELVASASTPTSTSTSTLKSKGHSHTLWILLGLAGAGAAGAAVAFAHHGGGQTVTVAAP